MKRLILSLTILAASAGVLAHDLGVQGNVWPIIEQDIRQMMVESAARTDWTVAQDAAKESARTYVDRLPKRKLPTVDRTQTEWLDPSIELASDIQAPVEQPDGTIVWRLLAKKGTRVNPLHHTRPVTGMFFFDGADKDQVALMKDLAQNEPDRVILIETGEGNILESSKLTGRQVFHANDALLSRFGVKYLPSFVYPGSGERQDYLGVTSYALPFSAAEVMMSWLGPVKPATTKPGAKK